jgi:ubiquinone/menaquinone biosynthesis C-methylase UbiE
MEYANKHMYISPLSKKELIFAENTVSTRDNTESYPIIKGIPVLINDYKEHMDEIEQLAHSEKAEWYSSDQFDYYEKGPYRHHVIKRKNYVQNEVKKYLQGLDTFIDLGCGDGYSSKWVIDLLPTSTKCLLTDYSFERLIKAKNNLREHKNSQFFLSDVTKCPIADSSVDFVFSTHVIEHLYNDTGIMQTAFRILKPGGTFLLGCPNEGVFWWMLAYALTPETIRTTDHKHFYNLETIKQKGEKEGFKVAESVLMGFGFPQWTVDSLLRRHKIIDDTFETLGKIFIPNMGSSMYVTFTKP